MISILQGFIELAKDRIKKGYSGRDARRRRANALEAIQLAQELIARLNDHPKARVRCETVALLTLLDAGGVFEDERASRHHPLVFVGSSKEGLAIAKAVQLNLCHACDVEIWCQGVIGPGDGTFEALVNSLTNYDFAILVLTPDDIVVSRGKVVQSARDNVFFELGLFVGCLGRDRTFAVCDGTKEIKLPSDLAGVELAKFRPHKSGNTQASLGAACTQIENTMTRRGLRRA